MRIEGLALIASIAACAGTARAPDIYRRDTQKLLEARTGQIKTCYEAALKDNASAAGTITLRFVVEKKTGKFASVTVDPAKSSAPEPVTLCLLDAINGLKMDPPDPNEGQATFTYEFKPTAPPT